MAYLTYTVIESVGSLTAKLYDTASWGVSGAPLKTDVTAAVLTISLSDPLTLMPDPTNTTTVDILALGYPLVSPVTLTSLDFGQALITDKIPDGVYGFSLAVTTSDTDPPEITTTIWYGGFYRQAECCADNMSNSRGCQCDECLTHKQINLLKMRLDFWAVALNERNCQNTDQMALAIIDAAELCEGRKCAACNC